MTLRLASIAALRVAADKRLAQGRARAIVVATLAVALLASTASPLFACPVCFGAEETSMIDGTKIGVLVMLAMTLAVQGAFVAFFFYLRRRARRIAGEELEEEWAELQRAPRTS